MISRRGLLTLGRKPFTLDSFYENRTTTDTIPHFRVRDGGVSTATSHVGVTREGSGYARVREADCLATTSFCSVCVERCPVEGAIVVELGRPRVDPTRCDGCGVCVGVCPAPRNALELVPHQRPAR
jgi:ferredoxin